MFEPQPKTLVDVLAALPSAKLQGGDPQTLVTGITHDSRRVEASWLFVAVPGLERNGLEFVPQAIQRGASVIVAERPPNASGVAVVVVPSARQALADLACALFEHPSRRLRVVGITGTDGKTTTAYLLSAILEQHGLRTGWLTTVNTKIGPELRRNAADNTTPEAPIVQSTLAEMLAAGVQVAILETSSHALELDRVRGTRFEIGVFTNLSPEHINFHGSFEAYRAAKRRLFESLPRDGLAVLNADDPSAGVMRTATLAACLSHGIVQPADVMASDLRLSASGTSFVLEPIGRRIQTRLVGAFNVSNWLAAYAAASRFGASVDDLAAAAAYQPPVPGRMNLVQRGQPFAALVDFAHTPQALGKALETVRGLVDGRVLLVFGLAGGRDVTNRAVMGELAAHLADHFIISMDDPGHEDPAMIAEQIAQGARRAGGSFEIDLDRRSAIRRVLSMARAGDAVLLAGKGHENRMVVGDQKLAWNDAAVAAEELERLGYHEATC